MSVDNNSSSTSIKSKVILVVGIVSILFISVLGYIFFKRLSKTSRNNEMEKYSHEVVELLKDYYTKEHTPTEDNTHIMLNYRLTGKEVDKYGQQPNVSPAVKEHYNKMFLAEQGKYMNAFKQIHQKTFIDIQMKIDKLKTDFKKVFDGSFLSNSEIQIEISEFLHRNIGEFSSIDELYFGNTINQWNYFCELCELIGAEHSERKFLKEGDYDFVEITPLSGYLPTREEIINENRTSLIFKAMTNRGLEWVVISFSSGFTKGTDLLLKIVKDKKWTGFVSRLPNKDNFLGLPIDPGTHIDTFVQPRYFDTNNIERKKEIFSKYNQYMSIIKKFEKLGWKSRTIVDSTMMFEGGTVRIDDIDYKKFMSKDLQTVTFNNPDSEIKILNDQKNALVATFKNGIRVKVVLMDNLIPSKVPPKSSGYFKDLILHAGQTGVVVGDDKIGDDTLIKVQWDDQKWQEWKDTGLDPEPTSSITKWYAFQKNNKWVKLKSFETSIHTGYLKIVSDEPLVPRPVNSKSSNAASSKRPSSETQQADGKTSNREIRPTELTHEPVPARPQIQSTNLNAISLSQSIEMSDSNPEGAIQGFRQALKADPSNVNARAWLAVVLYSQGRIAEFVTELRDARRNGQLEQMSQRNVRLKSVINKARVNQQLPADLTN